MTFYQKIENLIGINVEEYFSEVISFFENYNSSIIQYYTNSNAQYPKEAFGEYERLKEKANIILEKLGFYKGYFTNVEYWDILDKLDSIYLKFDVIATYPKFYKVTSIRKQNSSKIKESYVLKQNQNIENLASDRGEDWSDIAINNYLNEEDYTLKGGVKLVLKSSDANLNINPIESIIDIAIGENLLGKDFPEYLEFDSGDNDIKVLAPDETFYHTVRRLLGLKQGSLPEIPSVGIQKDVMSEATKGEGVYFPILIRQLSQTLSTDDTIVSFTITDIYKQEDNVFVKVECINRLSETIELENILE